LLRVIGLNGSPKKNGSTAYLLELTLKIARQEGAETELIHVEPLLQSQKYPYCRDCSSPCTGVCYRGSTMEQAFRILVQADAIIIGSPVYFGTVSAQIKGFWDKSRKLRSAHALLNKVGAAVTNGGGRFGGQETTLKTLHDMMLIQGMILVGDGHASADAGHPGCCAQAPAYGDKNALQRAEILARRVVEVARVTAALR
jgi:multimeric flavodoxin WrbA